MIESIVLGGGCFWCLEASYNLIKGVSSVVSGYAGGETKDPTYYDVAMDMTGHAEVVRIEFDSSIVSLRDIINIFWAIHDPTTLNRQGNDVGSEYRSIILYVNNEQKRVIEASLEHARSVWQDPIVTEVKLLDVFYEAEPEHQNFFDQHPEMAYCQVIINPKLQKLREKFTSKLR